ncbi:hypothetical protein SAMN05660772_00360 [Pasteurella testudinis DSM 23072]|uniref:Uncharacterized protein n=2 Tax=Pasteurella testudinis TaxID=761 RepID=A0A1W1UEC4_9PAST|nr:hypothetical protein SAMN05660772_00360 [Pasteurella testudinis DSM 23072]SUB50774.1 Uncharacterised protein [Pasteurella testudinis]
MVRACGENGVIFMAGHIINFLHGAQHAKSLIQQGTIGKVLFLNLEFDDNRFAFAKKTAIGLNLTAVVR